MFSNMINACSLFAVLFTSLFFQISSIEGQERVVDPSKILSFQIDYKESHSKLCWIGAHYDTDKSSQRHSVNASRHCHPYTLFYHSLFKDKTRADLSIAELGILEGSSLLMWKEYFENAKLYGFDNSIQLIDRFQQKFNNDRINLAYLDVTSVSSIANSFASLGVTYDLIIDDTTHQFEDQIRVVENVYPYLKNGGMLIIEDVFKRYREQDYIDRLKPLLDLFQDCYFVSMDHKNRCSVGWDNDKLLVLVKGGADPIFRNNKKMTIITPCVRPENLLKIRESIDFNYVDEWIIVYDKSKVPENPLVFAGEGNAKIKEYLHTSPGISGNPQRNYALDLLKNKDTYIYFLDDDNLVHEDLYKLLDIVDDGRIYTFNQKDRIRDGRIVPGRIDTAMFLIDSKLCKTVRWELDIYAADFIFIDECIKNNKDKWIYVDNDLCTYNQLR